MGHPKRAARPSRAVGSAPIADVSEPIRGIRKAMYAQMTLANAVPHFAYCDEVRG